jgi:hypothetical protein
VQHAIHIPDGAVFSLGDAGAADFAARCTVCATAGARRAQAWTAGAIQPAHALERVIECGRVWPPPRLQTGSKEAKEAREVALSRLFLLENFEPAAGLKTPVCEHCART